MPFWFFAAAAAAILVGGSKKTSSTSSATNNSSGNSGSGYWRETTVEQDLGYEDIPIIKPSFLGFKFTGLRPNTPHWIFFDGVQVNSYVSTTYGISDITEGVNATTFTNPGDQFITEAGFPSSLGGPGVGPFNTTSAGELEGMLYIQSNATVSFPAGRRVLTAIDISVLNKGNALSYGEVEVTYEGQYELYYEDITRTWVETVGNSGRGSDDTTSYDDISYTNVGTANNNNGTNRGSSDERAIPSYSNGIYGGAAAEYGGDTGYSGGKGPGKGATDAGPGTYGSASDFGAGDGSYSGTGRSGSSNVGDWGCFVPETLVEMFDGSTKAIADLRLGDHTRGGYVQGIHIYGGAPLYDYKGVKVSGTHYVIEDGEAVMVKDTEAAIKIADVKGLYTVDTTERRIYVNGVEFADHNGDGVIIDFFNNLTNNTNIITPSIDFEPMLTREIRSQVANATL